MYNHILVPLDNSKLAECVLPHVGSLARAFHARSTLLRIVECQDFEGEDRRTDPLDWSCRCREAEAYLKSVAMYLGAQDLEVEWAMMEGRPDQQITEFARKHGVDLIILSSHGRGGFSRWNVSSITQKVVQSACISTLIVRAYQPPVSSLKDLRYRSILVPLDCSLRAECALPVAIRLVQSHQAQLLLAHFVRKLEMPRNLVPTREEIELVGVVMKRRQQEAREYFDRLRSRLPVDFHDFIQVCDNVPVSLHEFVETQDIDLLILSAHGFSGEKKWPFGSLTNHLIQYGTTQLLIVQDFTPNQIEISRAELLAREHSGH